MDDLNKAYWTSRWENANTPWDIGGISPALRQYMDDLEDRSLRILIPGAGRAYEADYLFQKGFEQVFVCDWAAPALQALQRRLPNFPPAQLLESDYFELDIQVDLILEQTFFCALDPGLRERYVEHSARLLRPGGIVAGLLFAQPFPFQGPPFGGTAAEYRALFSPAFQMLQMELSPYSIQPRLGNELFFEMIRKA